MSPPSITSDRQDRLTKSLTPGTFQDPLEVDANTLEDLNVDEHGLGTPAKELGGRLTLARALPASPSLLP